MAFPPHPFWDYSLAAFGRREVARACITLQDRHGLDVNMLLLCCWAGAAGRPLANEQLGAVDGAARPWRDNVLGPLRAARRWLKDPPAAPAEAAALHEAVLAVELDGERIAQLAMAAALPPAPAANGALEPAALAARSLRDYLRLAGVVPGAADRADAAAILSGCFRGPDGAALTGAWT